jgi:hypothetical protein
MPGGIAGLPFPMENKYRNLVLQIEGVSNLRQQNLAMSLAELEPEKDYAGEAQQQQL